MIFIYWFKMFQAETGKFDFFQIIFHLSKFWIELFFNSVFARIIRSNTMFQTKQKSIVSYLQPVVRKILFLSFRLFYLRQPYVYEFIPNVQFELFIYYFAYLPCLHVCLKLMYTYKPIKREITYVYFCNWPLLININRINWSANWTKWCSQVTINL